MANNMYCPKCGKALIELANGKRYCKQCQTQYVVSSKTINSTSTQAKPQAKAKEKSSAPLVVLLLLLILLLGGVGGFALYHYFFGSSYIKFIEKEYAAYQAAGEPASLMSTDEAIAQAGKLSEGDPLDVMGIVEGIDDNLISLNNGIDCYIIPEALSTADAAKIEPALGAIHVGDVVGMKGMICDTAPFTLKYCSLPYKYYDGNKFYTEYEGFRRAGTYPDIAYNDGTYSTFLNLLNTGDIIYQTVPDVLNTFKAGGEVTATSFTQGADTYRDKAIGLSGRVTGIGSNYINIEGIYCFYFTDLLTDTDMELINSITINDSITVTGLVTNPSLDAFRLSYCTVTERIPAEDQAGQQEQGGQENQKGQEGPEPSDTISNLLYQVLMREKQYINEDGDQVYCDTVSDKLDTYTATSFAIIDMNGDGKNEAIFCETTGYASYTILYEYEGSIYGKNLGSQKSGLQTNGLFWDGSGEEGGVARCEINGNQCEMIMETWRRYEYNTLTDTGTFQYEIRDQAATEEEYNNYLNQIGWAEDVSAYAEFYDYTPENIRAILLA